MEFVSTLGAAGVLFGEFHAIQDTSLNDVVDRIYINVKDLPFQSLGALANILSDIKKGLIQDSHIWSFFQSFFKQYQLIISLNQIYQCLSSLMRSCPIFTLIIGKTDASVRS